jgi:hypothetical protein
MFGGQAPAKDNEGDRKTLYFFFSEKTSPAPEMAKAINAYLAKGRDDIALLPALLVEDWNTFLKVGETSPLYQTIRQLGKITPVQVFDEEALKLATAWKITRLPAVVIVARRRAHVLQGAAAGLEEIFGCAQ